MSILRRVLTIAASLLIATAAMANVTVTPASGGTNISADTAGSTYTSLGSIVITEGANGDFAVGAGVTLVLTAPTGWSFNPASGSVAATNGRNITGESVSVTSASATVTFTVGGTNKTDSMTISGLQVRPNNGSQSITANGNILSSASSTATIAGITHGSTNFGSLAMVAGAPHHLSVSTQPSPTATAGVAFATQPAIRIEDQFNNLRSSDNATIVTAARSAGTGTLQGTTTATASSGVATFTNLSHNVATTITIAFSATGLTGATSNNVVVSAANASKLLFTTSPAGATAGAPFATQPVVRTADAFDNFTSNGLGASVPITFSITSGTGTLLGTTLQDIGTAAGNGTVTTTDLQINQAGSFTLGVSGLGSATSSAFTVSAGAADHLAMVTQPPLSATAGVAFSPNPQVRIEDAYGNPRSDTTTITATRNSGSGTAALQGTTSVAAIAGTATFSNLSYNVAGETISIDFGASGLTGVTSSSITINPGPATTFTVAASPSSTTAGVAIGVTVTARDSVGNVATGYTGTVAFTSNDAQAVLPSNYTFTGGDAGVHVFAVTLATAGSRTVTATDTVTSSINGTSNSVTVSAASASALTVTAPGSATAGSPFSVTVTAVDAYNNTATSYTGTIAFSTSDANSPVLPSNYTFTGGDAGTHTFTNAVTLKTAGSQSITATDTVTGSINGSTNVSVGAATVNSLTISAPGSATAGTPFSVTVTAFDAFNNVATGYTGTVSFSTTDANSPVLPSNYTFTGGDAGTHTFTNGVTLKTAGTQTVSISDGTRNATSGNISVGAGTVNSLTISAPGSATAGTAFSVTVTAKDAYNNTATSYTGTVSFSTTDANSPVLPSNYTFTGGDAGTHTFTNGVTLKTAGTQTVSVSDGTRNATSGNVNVGAGTVNSLTISAPGSATAGSAFSVTVTARDAFNNTATSYTGTISFSTTDPGSPVLPSNYTFTGGDAGTHTFTNGVTLKTAGTQTVSVTDGTRNATSGNINVGAGTVNSLTISAPGSATAGAAFSVTVTARDAFNNTATGYTGTVSFSTTDASSPVLPSNYTFTGGDAGVHTFTNGVTLKTAGTQTVSVSDGTRNATSGNISVSAATVNSLTISAPGAATAGTPFSVTVTAKDAFNNTATSYTGTVSFSSTDPGSPVLPSNYTFTGGDAGVHTFTNGVTLKTAGTRTVSVNDGTRNATSGNITVSAGAAASLVVTLPASATAGTAFSGTVTAKDAYNNTATSYTGTIHFTTTDANAPVLPSNYTFTGGDAGVHTFTNGFTLKTAGSQSITATDTVTSSITGGASTTVNAGNAAQLGFFVQPAGAQAGSVFGTQPVIKTLDAYGNVTTQNIGNSKTVTITLQSGTGTLQGSTSINIGDNGPTPGTATFTNLRIDTTGSKVLRASNNTYGTVDSNAFTVTAGTATQLYFSTQPAGAVAGAAFTTQPVVKSRDSFGNDSNAGLGASKIVTMALLSGTGTLQGTTTVDIGTGAGNGTATYTDLRIDSAGAKTLRASASGLTNADSSSFTVSSGAAAVMTKIAGDGQTAAAGSTLPTDPSVRIDDAYANPVSGVSVTFAVTGGGGSVTGATQSTNASGVATVTSWTLGPAAGPNTLDATAGALAQTFTATATCTYTTKASGNWNAPSTWVGECVPNSGNDVTIASGHTVTVTANAQAGSLTFASATSDSAVVINSGVSLVVEGLVSIQSPSGIGVTSTMNVGDGTLDAGGLDLNGLGNRTALLTIHNGTAMFAGDATFGGNPPTQIIETTGNGSFEITGNFNAGASLDCNTASTFRFNGTEPQTIGTYNPNNFFPNVVIDDDVTLAGNMPIAGTLTINGGKSLDAGSGTLHLRGNFVDNGTFTSSGTTNVNGTAAQTFSGTADPIPFDNVTMNNAAGLTLATNVTVAGTLTLTSGNIATGAQTLTILSTGNVSRTSGHVIGNLAKIFGAAASKTFEVGTANGYSPVTVNATAGTFPATFTAKAVQSVHPNSPTGNALQRYWTLTNGSITQADLTFNYLASDVVGNELAYRLGRYDGGWTYPPASVDTLNHVASAAGITSFSDWTLHAQAVALRITAVNGGTNPVAGTPFSVNVEAIDAVGNATGVPSNTTIALSLTTGTGPLGGTLTGMIAAGSTSTTISGVTYTKAESGVVITASATSGATLASDDSDPFTVDPGPTTHFDVSAPGSATAGAPFTVVVTALDAYENVTPAFAGTVAITSTDAQAVLPADGPLTSGVGTYTNGVTLKTAGSQTITATSSAITGSANVTVSPAATDHLTLIAPASTTAGDTFSVDVTAYDAYGNVTPAYAETVGFTSSDSNATLPLSSTLTSGTKTFTGVVLTTAGAQTLTAGDGTLSDDASITVNPAATSHFDVSAPANATAGTPFTITVTALDVYGNVTPAFAGTVSITATDAQAVLPADAPLTSGVGTYTNGVTLKTAGLQTITATSSAITGTADVTVSPAATDHLTLVAPASTTAGATFSVDVTAYDAYGNVTPAYAELVGFTSSDPNATLPSSSTLTSGTKTFTGVVLTTAGAQTLTASDGSLSDVANITVNPAATTHFDVTAPGTVTAGTPFTVTVTARDAYENTTPAYAGTVGFTSSDANATLPSASTLTSGTKNFTGVVLTTAGAQTLTASDGSLSGLANVTVEPGATTHFDVSAPGSATAGAPFTITVTARDAYENTTPAFAGTVGITSTDAQAVLPADGPLTSGVGTYTNGVTLKTAGSQTITATSSAITGSANVAVLPAATDHLTLVAPASTTAGDTFSVDVTAYDAYGNVTPAYAGTVGFTSSDSNATLPSASTLTSGTKTFTGVVLTTAGAQTLTASDGTLSDIANITVNPAATSHFDVTAPANATAGTPFTITVTARDAYENTTPTFAGTVSITATDAQAVLPADAPLTSGVGTYTNGVTLKTAGPQTITATSAAISGDANITVSPAATDHLTLVAPPTTTAGDTFSVDVTAYDAYGNVTPAYAGTVAISSSDPNATLPSASTLTSGTKTFTGVVLTTAGAQTLTAGDGSLSDLANITVKPASLDHFLVDAAGGGSIAPQTAGVPFNIEIIARDAYENTVTGFSETVQITSNGTLTGAPVTSAALTNGVLASESLTITSAQTNTTISVVDTISGRNGTSNPFTVNPAGTASFLVEAGSGGSIAPQVAGTPFAVRVTARDAFGNTDTAFTGTLDLTSNAGAVSPLSVTFAGADNGIRTFNVTLTNANAAAVLTATHTPSSNTGSSNAFAVNAAGAASYLVEAAAGGNIAPQTAGIPFGIRVTARDSFGNTATTFTGTLDITTNLGDIAPTTLAFTGADSGVKTTNVTLTASGTNRTITASDVNGTGTSNAFTVNAGALDHFRVEAAGGGAIGTQNAGTPFAIMITALDENDNVVPSFNGTGNTVDITSTHTLATGGATTATFVNGVLASHSVSYNSSGSGVTITATRTGGSESGTSNAFAIGGLPDLDVTFSGPASIDAGDGEMFTFNVTNDGVAVATNVMLALALPSGWAGHAYAPCAALPCNLGTLAPAASVSVSIWISTPASASGRRTITATVSSDVSDANNGNNSASHDVTIGHCPTLSSLSPAGSGPLNGVLTWSASEANSFDVYFGVEGSGCSTFVGTTHERRFAYSGLEAGRTYEWRVVAHRTGCPPVSSACVTFTTSCAAPEISAVAETMTGATYHVRWTDTGAAHYVLEESATDDFASATSSTIDGLSAAFRHDVAAPTPFFYRVRGDGGCSDETSATARVVVQPPGSPDDDEFDLVVEEGAGEDLEQEIHLDGQQGIRALAAGFTATTTAPWASVSPAAGTIPPEGLTLTLTANAAELPAGANTTTVNVRATDGSLLAAFPVTLHAITGVAKGGKSATAAESAIIPAVGHATGINSHWRSDVRIFNPSNAEATYELWFTPSRIDGRTDGRHAALTVAAGSTIALGDIVRHLFGYGTLGAESATGALEIRSSGDTAAPVITSRTYNATATGTYGQYIGAVLASRFATAGTRLSLQQVAQSQAYRTNIGLVEGSGNGANVTIRVFDAANAKLLELPVGLAAFEQRQLDSLLAQNSVEADDARVEVEVLSGSIAAYASVVDAHTNDPLLVPAVDPSKIVAMRYVVPGIADFTSSRNTWRSDVRIYNASNASVQARAIFYGETGETVERAITLAPRSVQAYDSVLETLFGLTNHGGALHITTAAASSLVVTARTYDRREGGTYGQFIPAMTIDDAAALGGRTLELLHVDQSVRFRSNIGVAEVAGQEATVEITAHVPDGRTATTTRTLAPFQFAQYGSLLAILGFDDTTNARLSIRVIAGQGAVVAYVSNIDNRTQDPTYVPAQ